MKYVILILMFNCYSYADWQSVSGMNGGSIKELIHNNDKLYACICTFPNGSDTKIYQSSDNGSNWNLIFSLPIKSMGCQLLFKDNSIFLGINTISDNYIKSHGLYYSFDNGKTWEKKYIEENKNQIIYFIKEFNDTIYLGTSNCIYTSSDWGNNWKKLPNLIKNNITIFPQNFYLINNNYYAIDALKGFYRSNDYGNSWSDLYFSDIYISGILDYSGILYLYSSKGIYKSVDNGQNWISSGLFGYNVSQLSVYKNVMYASTNKEIYFSLNQGLNWEKFSDIQSYTFTIINDTIFIGNNTGIFKSSITEPSFIFSSNGINSISPNNIIKLNKETLISSTSYNGLFLSTDSGNNWQEFNIPIKFSMLNSVDKFQNKLYCCSAEGIFISEDDGKTWKSSNSGLAHPSVSKLFDIEGNLYCNNRLGGLYSFENENWEFWNNNLKPYYIYSMLLDKGKTFLGTDHLGIQFSEDNGKNWKTSNTGFPTMNIYIWKIIKFHDIIYAATTSGLYSYNEKEDNWNQIYTKYNIKNVKDIIATDSSLIIIDDNSVLISKDEGKNWVDISSNLKNKEIYRVNIIDSTIFALCNKSGMYKTYLKEIDSIYSAFTTETYDYLYTMPPYPLPATKEVRSLIYWSNDKNFNLDNVSIYNIRGLKLIDIKLNLDKISNYSGYLIWDCSNVESGIYIIYITHGTESKAVKVIVIK